MRSPFGHFDIVAGAGVYPGRVIPGRFVTDASLDLLARRLRLLGFDVVTLRGARLEALFEAARNDGRIVLTTSARHPRRHADVPAMSVARGDPASALRDLAATFAPAGAPFERCSVCNRPLVEAPAAGAPEAVPAPVRAAGGTLRHCPGCGRWYWHGSHVDRLREWLERALGRKLG